MCFLPAVLPLVAAVGPVGWVGVVGRCVVGRGGGVVLYSLIWMDELGLD